MDDDDFSTLYRHEYPSVLRVVALIVGSQEAARDVTQEAFVQLYLHWTKVRTYERPGAWVRRVAIRGAVKMAKRAPAPALPHEPPAAASRSFGESDEVAHFDASPPPIDTIRGRARIVTSRRRRAVAFGGTCVVVLLCVGAIAWRPVGGPPPGDRIDIVAPPTSIPDLSPAGPSPASTRPSGLPVEGSEVCAARIVPYVFSYLPDSFRTERNAFWIDPAQRTRIRATASPSSGPARLENDAGNSITLLLDSPPDNRRGAAFRVLGADAFLSTSGVDIAVWVGPCFGLKLVVVGISSEERQRIAQGLRPVLDELYQTNEPIGLWPITTVVEASASITQAPDGWLPSPGRLSADFDATAVLFGSEWFGSPHGISSHAFYDGRQADLRLGDGTAVRMQTLHGTGLWLVVDFARLPVTEASVQSRGMISLQWGSYTGPRPGVYALKKSDVDDFVLVYLTSTGPVGGAVNVAPARGDVSGAGPDRYLLPELTPGIWRVCTIKPSINTCAFIIAS